MHTFSRTNELPNIVLIGPENLHAATLGEVEKLHPHSAFKLDLRHGTARGDVDSWARRCLLSRASASIRLEPIGFL